MIHCIRTNSTDEEFVKLVRGLDEELSIRDGEDHSFYAQFNKVDMIKYVIVAYENESPVGCGAIKEYDADTMEIKRMFVPLENRKKGIATLILKQLELWASELMYGKCILETGKKQPEAIELYKRNHYTVIPNYGQYENVEDSVCFEKHLDDKQTISDTIYYRLLNEHDIENYILLRTECLGQFPDNFGTLLHEEIERKFPFTAILQNSDDNKFMWGAFSAPNTLIGICGFRAEQREKTNHRGDLVQLYVTPAYKGMGIGKQLVYQTIRKAFENQHIEQIILGVVEHNSNAIRIYTELGFRQYGKLENYFKTEQNSYTQCFMYLNKSR